MARKNTSATISQKDGTNQNVTWFEQLHRSLTPLDGQLILALSLTEKAKRIYELVPTGCSCGRGVNCSICGENNLINYDNIPTDELEYGYIDGSIITARLNGEITRQGNDASIPIKDTWTWSRYEYDPRTIYFGRHPIFGNVKSEGNLILSPRYRKHGNPHEPILLWNGNQLLGKDRFDGIKIDPEDWDLRSKHPLELVLAGNANASNFFGVSECVDTQSLFSAYYTKCIGYAKRSGYFNGPLSQSPQGSVVRLSKRLERCLSKLVNDFVLVEMYSRLGIPQPKTPPKIRLDDLLI